MIICMLQRMFRPIGLGLANAIAVVIIDLSTLIN